MELVTKKRLAALLRALQPASWPPTSPPHLGVELGEPNLSPVRQRRDALPLRRVDPGRRRLHRPEPQQPGERRDHGAADHDRRGQAGLGQADHRRLPLLRLRPPGPQGVGPGADHRQAAWPTCSRSPAPTAWSASTCTPARSRASSTCPVDHLTAMPVLTDWVSANLGSDVVIVSPDAGRFKVAERFAQHARGRRRLGGQAPAPGRGQPGRGPRRHGRRRRAASACSSTT